MRSPALVALGLLVVAGPAWPQGNPVGPEFRVNTYTAGSQDAPSVAADSSGFVVVWTGQAGYNFEVFGQRYAPTGDALGLEFRVNTQTSGYHGAPSVAMGLAGNFVVVWQSDDGGPYGSSAGIFGQRYASSGTPLGPEFRVNTHTTNEQQTPAVAMDASGNFVVVWDTTGQDGSYAGIYGQRYASSGTPIGPEFRVNTFTTSYQREPSVATDSSGNFVVVWQSWDQDGALYGVIGQRYAGSGAPLGTDFRVNTYTTGNQYHPSVAVDSSGNFVVVWQSAGQDFGGRGIFGQRYANTGTPQGGEFRVSHSTADQIYPTVAADPSGNFVIAWTSDKQDPNRSVFAQRYASSGDSLGSTFRVNTYTLSFHRGPSVAAESLGNFVVTWVSDGQDGSSFGVFGQRYNMIVPVELMHFRVE